MPPAWRLATNSLSGRALRTGLLIAAVTLATSLVAAVSCAVASANQAMRQRVEETVGAAEARLKEVGGKRFEAEILEVVRSWPEVRIASPREEDAIPLKNPDTGASDVAKGFGIDPESDRALRTLPLRSGRSVEAHGEIVVDPLLLDSLGAEVGGTVAVDRFGEPMSVRIVGVTRGSPFAEFGKPEAFVTRETLERITGYSGRLTEIAIGLKDGVDVFEFADRRGEELPESLVIEPTERITSGLDRNLKSSRVAFVLMSVLAFIAAGFIILTGLTTTVLERQRELAIIRSVGGGAGQIGTAQLLTGGFLGVSGAILGVPLGVGIAWGASIILRDHLTAGLHVSAFGLGLAGAGAILAGLGGAAWPAVMAARLSPLEGLAIRARKPSRRAVVVAGAVGAAGALIQFSLITFLQDGQLMFWSHATFGAPIMFIGYFLMGAPLVVILARLVGPFLSAALRLPRSLLLESIRSTPFRHGFTAGALMAGLALMVAIWTEGSAVLRDWIGAIAFPDAFVHGWRGITEEQRDRIDALPFVENSAALTMQQVGADAFGIRLLQSVDTNFIAFEPDRFFAMTKLTWIEGDPERAQRRLEEGGAILVAREFRTANGLGVGDVFTIEHNGEPIDFEIAGVVTSPGLDIASRYFDIGNQFANQALHAVFGTRADLKEKFGSDAIHLLQIDLSDSVTDEKALSEIRRTLGGTLLVAGSGREIKATIAQIGGRTMRVMSIVAVGAIVIACFGVGNVVVAGINARRFEFGVLRAVGASKGLLARLILAETLLIALTACLLGTVLGLQATWTGLRLYERLAGLELRLIPPLLPIAAGWAILTLLTLGAAAPAILALLRGAPRALLTSRG